MDKQIEEMAQIIALKAFEQAHLIDGDENLADIVATDLYEKGYRKAEDVAREIFEEIETAFDEMIEEATDQLLSARLECDVKAVKTMEYGIDVIRLVHRTLKKSLKKKYIGEDTNVLTNTEDGE